MAENTNIHWTEGTFIITHSDGTPAKKQGWISKNFGIHSTYNRSYNLTHLTTGCMVANLHGQITDVKKTANKIAGLIDWSICKTANDCITQSPHIKNKITAIAKIHNEFPEVN